jgi:RNA polymerase sigma factor (sigma-70 family)
MNEAFHLRVVALFEANHDRLFRYLARQCDDPDLAEDVVQDAFVRLYARGELPHCPEAWLISVASNLFRNARSQLTRRRRLLTPDRGEHSLGDASAWPDEQTGAREQRERVRRALDHLPERERRLLLLRAEGYSYRDMAEALDLNEASIGTLLARAKQAFRAVHEEASHAS